MNTLKPLPHRIPHQNQRLARKCVTLVAGFRCKNGVVICADTEHTAFPTKYNAPKLWTDRNRTLVAAAGDDAYTKTAVDELSSKFSQPKMKWTAEGVTKSVKEVLLDVHHSIRGAYEGLDPNRPTVYLMLGARLDDWSTILIKGSQTATPIVSDFDIIGSGQEIARFLLSPFYDPDLRVTEMQVIAGYCFRFAKASGIYAGGETHIGTLFDGVPDAEYAHPAYLKSDPQVVTNHILHELAPALSAAWNVNVSREDFEKRVGTLVDWLRFLRKRQEETGKPNVFISSRQEPSK